MPVFRKSVVAVACTACLFTLPSHAVTIYGEMHQSISHTSYADDFPANPASSASVVEVTSRESFIGFRGTEDLGNGLSVMFDAKWGIRLDNGLRNLNRTAYLGVHKETLGALMLGHLDTPMKTAFEQMDPFQDTVADNNQTVGFTDFRAAGSILYVSPTINGITISGMLIPGAQYEAGIDGIVAGYSAAASYSTDNLYAAIAYEDLSDLFASATLYEHWRAGLSYHFDQLQLTGIYERSNFQGDGDAEPVPADKYQLAAAYTLGNSMLSAAFGRFQNQDEDPYDSWTLGVMHNLSKRTQVYALYTDMDGYFNTTEDGSERAAPGYLTGWLATDTGSAGYSGIVRDVSSFSLGMKHIF